jgi:hypothetical protein
MVQVIGGRIMKYVLRNKNTKTYLKYLKTIRWKHYVLNRDEATVLNATEVKRMLKTFKHPENWEIVKVN